MPHSPSTVGSRLVALTSPLPTAAPALVKAATPAVAAARVYSGTSPAEAPAATAARVYSTTSPAEPFGGSPALAPLERPHLIGTALFGSIPAMAFYLITVREACIAPFATPQWFVRVLLMLTSSMMAAAALLPTAIQRLDSRVGVRFWTALLGMHLFASTGPALLAAILSPVLSSALSRSMLICSSTMVWLGGLSEIYAHFLDGWWIYTTGAGAAPEAVDTAPCAAIDGDANLLFCVGLVGGFAFLSVAAYPSVPAMLSACALPAVVAAVPLVAEWKRCKPFVFAMQGLSSVVACAVMVRRLRSFWPLLYFVQAWNIIRNVKRVLKTGQQHLHMLPSVYGWFSYVVPFGLAVLPGASRLPLHVVGAAALASIGLTSCLEDAVVRWADGCRAAESLDAFN